MVLRREVSHFLGVTLSNATGSPLDPLSHFLQSRPKRDRPVLTMDHGLRSPCLTRLVPTCKSNPKRIALTKADPAKAGGAKPLVLASPRRVCDAPKDLQAAELPNAARRLRFTAAVPAYVVRARLGDSKTS